MATGQRAIFAACSSTTRSVRDINARSRKVRPLQAAPGLVDGWLRPPDTGRWRLVEGAKGFETWEEAEEAGRFLAARR